MSNYDKMVLIFACLHSGFCHLVSFYEPPSFYFAHIYFFLLTSKDIFLLSHHPKHQLSTCISIGLCSGAAFPHIFYLCVIACLISGFPCVSQYILCHTPSVGYSSYLHVYLYLCDSVIQIVINLNSCIISGTTSIKNDIEFNCNGSSRSVSIL